MFRTVVWVFCCIFLITGEAAAEVASEVAPEIAAGDAVQWKTLEPGLELARVAVSFISPDSLVNTLDVPALSTPPEPIPAVTTVLRIDPEQFAFSLYMASESGLKTVADVGKSENFAAAINAGMFQRDGLTNTGYLRSRTHTNNKHVAANFGAFFVAEPESGTPSEKTLPPARLLDRQTDDWESALARYGIVLQNYRMATSTGRVLWQPSERFHSVAALSEDAAGRILFVLCSTPVPAAEYVAALLRLPLGMRTVMYLEGGSEAALYLNAGGINTVETGLHISGFWEGGGLVLPNVLGIRRRAETAAKPAAAR